MFLHICDLNFAAHLTFDKYGRRLLFIPVTYGSDSPAGTMILNHMYVKKSRRLGGFTLVLGADLLENFIRPQQAAVPSAIGR